MELSGKTLAITGAGGFIGLRMVERARERGMLVRGLDTSATAARRAEAAGAEVIVGDVNDGDKVRRLCSGADIVFHTAAVVKESGPWKLFHKVNVEGSYNVASIARDSGVQRFVHLSSVMVYGYHYPRDVAEDGPLRGEGNPYCQTKIESEQAVQSHHEPGGLEVIVIRPGDVYGPGSVPWITRPLEMMRQGIFVLIDSGLGVVNPVYVDDLLDAVFLALERDATGQAFNVTGGQAVTCAEFFAYHAGWLGKRSFFTMPSYLMRPLGQALHVGSSALRRDPPFTAASVDFLTRRHAYSIEKARRVLGYEPRVSLQEGMKRVAESMHLTDRQSASTGR